MAHGDRFISYHSFEGIVEGIRHLEDYSPSYGFLARLPFNRVKLTEVANGHVAFEISRRRGMWHLVTISGELERIEHNRTQVAVETIMYGRVFWLLAAMAIIGLPIFALVFAEYLAFYVFVCVVGFGWHIFDTYFESSFLLDQFGRLVE